MRPRVHAVSGGFLGPSAQARRIRRIMALAGYPIRIGWPKTSDLIAAWGHAPRAARAEALASHTGAAILRVEDAFLRSLFPGRRGEPTLGLLLDQQGIYYDPSRPSDLETLLATHPLDDHALLQTARLCMARLRAHHLSKYSGTDPKIPPPPPGYVLVIDQVRGDASLRHGGLHGPLSPHIFREMLVQAQLDHPTARIVIRTHPENAQGLRPVISPHKTSPSVSPFTMRGARHGTCWKVRLPSIPSVPRWGSKRSLRAIARMSGGCPSMRAGG